MINNEKKILKAFDSNTNKEVISSNNRSNYSFENRFMSNMRRAKHFLSRIKSYFSESEDYFFEYDPAGEMKEMDIYNKQEEVSDDFVETDKYQIVFKRLLQTPPVMIEFLKLFGFTDPADFDFELRGWSRWLCEKDGVFLFPLLKLGSLNAYKKSLHAKRAVGRIMNALDILSDIESFYVNFLTLTTPQELDSYILEHNINPNDFMRGAMKEFRKNFEKKFNFKMNGEYNIHTWSTRRPLEPHFHIHSFFLNLQIDKNGEISKLPIERLYNGLKTLRACWYEALKKTLKKYMIPLDISIYRDNLNLHFSYLQYTRSNLGAILHKLKYSRRSYIMDLNDYFWDNPIPEDYQPNFVSNALFYGIKNRTYRFGFFAKLRKRIEKVVYSNVENIIEQDVMLQSFTDKRQRCPVCGRRMEYLGREGAHLIPVGAIVMSEYRNRLFYVKNKTLGGG